MKRLVTAAVGAVALLGVSVASASAATVSATISFTGDCIGSGAFEYDPSTGFMNTSSFSASLCGLTWTYRYFDPYPPLNGYAQTASNPLLNLYIFPGATWLIFDEAAGNPLQDGQYTVSAVPLPAGAWLLLSALSGLGFAGWRRRKAVAA